MQRPASQALPGRGHVVRVGHLVLLPGMLAAAGVDPAPLFEATGLDADHFAHPDQKLDFQAGSRFFQLAAEALDDDHLGVALGSHFELDHLGLVGMVARTAPTLGEALQALDRAMVLHDEAGTMQVNPSGEHIFLSYVLHDADVHAPELIYEMSLVVTCRLLRGLLGEGFNPLEVRFSRFAPDDPRPLRRLFRCPLVFDSTDNCLIFPQALLAEPLPGADPELHAFFVQEAAVASAGSAPSMDDSVAAATARCMRNGDHSLEAVARSLQLHPRTLNRRLQAIGLTFRDLRDTLLQVRAAYLLEHTGAAVGEIADALGYADTSAFDHAFKRWFGRSPEQFRAEKRAASGADQPRA